MCGQRDGWLDEKLSDKRKDVWKMDDRFTDGKKDGYLNRGLDGWMTRWLNKKCLDEQVAF